MAWSISAKHSPRAKRGPRSARACTGPWPWPMARPPHDGPAHQQAGPLHRRGQLPPLGQERRGWPRPGCSRCRGCGGVSMRGGGEEMHLAAVEKAGRRALPPGGPPITKAARAPRPTSSLAASSMAARSLMGRPKSSARLIQVGGDQRGPGQEHGAHRGHRLGGQQAAAALGHHHRVHHHRGLDPGQEPGHQLNQLGRVQHAGFYGVRADVLDDRRELLFHEVQGHRVHRAHPHRCSGRSAR